MIVFLTGASGVGKTTIANEIARKYAHRGWEVVHFDSVGVPEFQDAKSAEDWQRSTTHAWIEKLIARKSPGNILIEGSAHLRFIIEGFEKHRYDDFKIVLIDCSEAEMIRRLKEERAQPELANPDMVNWLRHLRRQAEAYSIEVLDTTDLTPEEAAERLVDGLLLSG